MIYLENEIADIEFAREDIFGEDDPAKLIAYRDAIRPTVEELSIMAASFKQGGMECIDVCYKLGRLKIGMHWIAKRLEALGHEDDDNSKVKAQAAHITTLTNQVAILKARIAELEAAPQMLAA